MTSTRVFGRLNFITQPPVLALLFAGFLLCLVGFSLRTQALHGKPTPDGQKWYTQEELKTVFNDMGEDGRSLYALSEYTLDGVFPLLYGGLFAGLLAHVYPRRAVRWIVLLPLAAMVGDWSENMHFAHLACHFKDFDQVAMTLYRTAVGSSLTTAVCFTLSVGALIVGGIGRLGNCWTSAITAN